jgi:DNA-binding NarL/FixJ family response regulator
MPRTITGPLTREIKDSLSVPIDATSVKTILVESHSLMRVALHRVVSTFPQIELVAVVDEVQELLRHLTRSVAQVIVVGISVSTTDCLEIANYLRKHQSQTALVIIRHSLRSEMVMALIKQGIHGLLDEFASERDLADAISVVTTGSVFLNKHAREALVLSAHQQFAITLTVRELEVTALLRQGESNFRIAKSLGLKEKTVEAYLTRIYSKLGVNSRAEAIVRLQNLYT